MKSEASVISDLVLLSSVGLRVILVHGGGPEINQFLGRLGLDANFVNGLRVTDAATMEVASMVFVRKVNKHLVALINKAGATAVGLCGIDGHLLTARPCPDSDQLGFVGDIASVDPSILQPLIDNNHIPVIASVAANETVEIFIRVEEAEQEKGILQIEGWMVGLNGSRTEATHLACTDGYGRRGQAPIRDDESMSWIYRVAHLRPTLYVEVADEPVQDVGEGTCGGQYDGAGTSGVGGTDEDGDETEGDVQASSDEEYVSFDESDDD
ncbi:OLC1v1001567C1 [Oldenlandia corymbosa var. corymbosa]|uniref:OLC1v1001567C1 n=1 Tax=Oldenlandia corymbosa var. corymbosa TaxID=529605 RepID=A0AAV1D6P8_OLDCO|nr:OLC1v1001567C1 [Oldenlandia corymbosa var. corymbosa]